MSRLDAGVASPVRRHRPELAIDGGPIAPEVRRVHSVKAWASIGGAVLVFQAYLFAAWVISGDFKRTPNGPTPIPKFMQVAALVVDIALPVACVAIIYLWVVRPWRRDGRLTWDGLFVLALPTLLWQDVIANYITPWTTYNTALFNRGSWRPQIPGWTSPNGEYLAEALLSAGSAAYIWFLSVPVFIANRVMRTANDRRPHLTKPRLVTYALAGFFVLDAVAESLMMRLGLFAYPASIQVWGLTLFPGKYYQMPLYAEAVGVGCLLTAFACFRYFRNDRGESPAERGISELRCGARARTVVRYLAIVGALNAIMFCFFSWLAFWGLHADSWPEDITKRSYLTDQLCGLGTTYACPGPDVPINRPDSLHVSPDGKLVGGR